MLHILLTIVLLLGSTGGVCEPFEAATAAELELTPDEIAITVVDLGVPRTAAPVLPPREHELELPQREPGRVFRPPRA